MKEAKYQLKALLMRNNILYEGTANWSKKYLRWLTELILLHPAQQIVLQEQLQTIEERIRRLERLDNDLTHHVHQWRYYPVLKAIQAMRGVRLTVAVSMVAELADLHRFDHPRKLMGYLGLVPSEQSSGGKRHLGAITKSGNDIVRRLLIEGTYSYRYPAKISTQLQLRQEGLPKGIVDIVWKA